MLLENPTKILFFTGKGGVGKTSLACATAISLSDDEKKVLLVSTDPASNLDEVLGLELVSQPREVPGVSGLSALNIDPEEAARQYRERLVGPYRGVLPESAIQSMEEQLSGGCTLEIAAFDEFTALLGDPDLFQTFDHLVFDTAPTGHTLRLLELPAAWTNFIDSNVGGTSCLGPLAGLEKQQILYAKSRETLEDAETTTLVLVTRPEPSALREAERTSSELASLGVSRQTVVVNGVFRATDRDDPVARAREENSERALSKMPSNLSRLPRKEIPLLPWSPVGIAGLRALLKGKNPPETHVLPSSPYEGHQLGEMVEEIAQNPKGVVLTMGKGGVGKTTVAATVAVELARNGHNVLLTTTDPAAHVSEAVQEQIPHLEIARIDPREEVRLYKDEVMATAGAELDEPGKAVLEEDLRSPCTEEIAVFRAFARTVARGEEQLVVIDTAPTGHTILLLDAAEAYHKEVLKKPGSSPQAVRDLLPHLRDPDFTKVILVTLPEATPVHEAASLESDLERAGIHPFGWVVNQSLSPLKVTDPTLLSRQAAEAPYIEEVAERAKRYAVEPWRVEGSPILNKQELSKT